MFQWNAHDSGMWTRANESMPWSTEREGAIEKEMEIERLHTKIQGSKFFAVMSARARTFWVYNDKKTADKNMKIACKNVEMCNYLSIHHSPVPYHAWL